MFGISLSNLNNAFRKNLTRWLSNGCYLKSIAFSFTANRDLIKAPFCVLLIVADEMHLSTSQDGTVAAREQSTTRSDPVDRKSVQCNFDSTYFAFQNCSRSRRSRATVM